MDDRRITIIDQYSTPSEIAEFQKDFIIDNNEKEINSSTQNNNIYFTQQNWNILRIDSGSMDYGEALIKTGKATREEVDEMKRQAHEYNKLL